MSRKSLGTSPWCQIRRLVPEGAAAPEGRSSPRHGVEAEFAAAELGRASGYSCGRTARLRAAQTVIRLGNSMGLVHRL